MARTEFQAFEGSDPWAYVVSMNLHRRHLTDAQRPMGAASIANLKHGSNQFAKESSIDDSFAGPTGAEAREMLHVSEGSFDRAKKIHKYGSELLKQAVTDGNVSLTKGAELAIKHEETEQDKAVDRHIKTAASPAQRLRFGSAVDTAKLISELAQSPGPLVLVSNGRELAGLRHVNGNEAPHQTPRHYR